MLSQRFHSGYVTVESPSSGSKLMKISCEGDGLQAASVTANPYGFSHEVALLILLRH